MTLQIQNIIPYPLQDNLVNRKSAIWKQEIDFNSAETIFIKAPSGTGKTTFIQSLYGIRNDYEGVILWFNKNIKTYSVEELAQLRAQKISIIFQDLRLFPDLTAWENVMLKQQLTNTTTIELVENYFDKLGISKKKNCLASTLSYGEQQRVAIIRALVQPFSFLLMDEPFSHLDLLNKTKSIELIQAVVQKNNASILLADLDDNQYFNYTQTLIL